MLAGTAVDAQAAALRPFTPGSALKMRIVAANLAKDNSTLKRLA
ncbi:hypothetical protein Mesop_3096 [Mesorhizobium opportunistum WSM2075]|uniref:Uncharacterized protein n=1 Tax=Mesorhizobium opportunistum (strain LMG 24607 / HAMBI 3007 / WSM2075) TaxID=536019 RepID=F7Y893_MESOW|nr:hypothetical protein Mesop_3096 [Mesorhizobium opportunistum WSM2075]